MTEQDIGRFSDSFQRCMEDPAFFDIFYDEFLASSPEVAAKFKVTDFKKQKRMLRSSLYVISSAVARRKPDYAHLDEIAERHGRSDADIPPYMYGLWLESLLQTVARCDKQYDPEVARSWREVMEQAIRYMVSRY